MVTVKFLSSNHLSSLKLFSDSDTLFLNTGILQAQLVDEETIIAGTIS
jgi:hypothetical protein